MTTISTLPRDLIEEILSRVPLKSMRAVRLNCKKWDTLSKTQSFTKMHIGKVATTTREGESMMIAEMDYNLYLMRVVVNIDPYKELKGKLTCLHEQVKVSKVFHCQGLLLCILEDHMTKVVVWNPYCGQTRWIQTRLSHHRSGWEKFAIGYEVKKSCLRFKILMFIDDYNLTPNKQFFAYQVYDFDSDLWITLDIIPHWNILLHDQGLSLKGNTYWCARERKTAGIIDHIICFDFTRERFGPLLPLPSSAVDRKYGYVTLCCVREEKLAALFQHHEPNRNELEIWITTKIETEIVSWSKFLRIDMESGIRIPYIKKGFFIDEEKKVAMGFKLEKYRRGKFIIIGEDGYFRELDRGENIDRKYDWPQVCSYVPSLVQIKKNACRGNKART